MAAFSFTYLLHIYFCVYLCRQQLRHSHAHSIEHRVGKAYVLVAVFYEMCKALSIEPHFSYLCITVIFPCICFVSFGSISMRVPSRKGARCKA